MSATLARRKAESLVTQYKLKPAFDLNRLAKKLEVDVQTMKLEDASGLLITRRGYVPCIVLNSEDHPSRQRFTFAHEIGHFVLEHHFQGVHVDRGNVSFRNVRSSTGADPREVEANQFAATLLMPAHFVEQEVNQRAGADGSLSEKNVDELADFFKVSVQAMTIRLNALKLI